MKYRSIVCTIVLVMVLSLTIGFSAFVSEMSISHIVADVKPVKDVRITDVEIIDNESKGYIVNNLEYDSDSVMGDMSFEHDGSYFVLKITVTNFGNMNVGVGDVSFNNSDMIFVYSIEPSEDMIEAGGNTKEYLFQIAVPSNSQAVYTFKLDLDFRTIYPIIYDNVSGGATKYMEGYDASIWINGIDPAYVQVYVNDNLLPTMEYQISGDTIVVSNASGVITVKGPKTLNNIISLNAKADSNIKFNETPEIGKYYNNSYDGSAIYYYRGAVNDNNVLFGGFCWKIVRSTNTGGIKLIYNGQLNSRGECNSQGIESSQITTTAFNMEYESPTHVGYMYGDSNKAYEKDLSSQSGMYVFGNDVEWRNGYYVLKNTISSQNTINDKTKILEKYHYTCFGSMSQCEYVYYVNNISNEGYAYYFALYDGDTIDTIKNKMFVNTINSNIKNVVDDWYGNNMNIYTSFLEDTVWCNDRNLASGPLVGKDSAGGIANSEFASHIRNFSTYQPSLLCSENDSFTVRLENGNGKLTYPVGLLTADEVTMAGSGKSGFSSESYLNTRYAWWTMTPNDFAYMYAGVNYVTPTGQLSYYSVPNYYGVRPAISLKPNSIVASGNGTLSNPYRIKSKFMLSGSTYFYEVGMTWGEWIDSEYNTSGIINVNGIPTLQGNPIKNVSINDKIDNGINYGVIVPTYIGGADN